MSWLKPWDYTPPDPQKTSKGDYILGCAVLRDLLNADSNFLSGKMGPQYASPDAYVANMVAFAHSPTMHLFPLSDPDTSAVKAAMDCFTMLAQLPVNVGDPNTVSVMQAWQAGTGNLFGGHDPITPPAPGTSATGQGSIVGPSIL